MSRRFAYSYKTSEGTRHEAEMVASTREEVFTELRKQGIRPIKVVDQGGSTLGVGVKVGLVVAVLGLCVGVAFFLTRIPQPPNQPPVKEKHPTAFYAKPLVRQPIHWGETPIEKVVSAAFSHVSEQYLARFAEPGVRVEKSALDPVTERDFGVALKDPILVAPDEHSEQIDLKRIVCGLKREMSAYLAGGGTIRGYVDELQKRQEKEVKIREGVEKDVFSRIRSSKGEEELSKVYDYLLKANASLQSMGIKPVDIPSELLSFQSLPLAID